jgi:hypothetical protein
MTFWIPWFSRKWQVNRTFPENYRTFCFKHLIMCREVSTKHLEWFWKKSDHILKPLIFRKISGKWKISRKLWNILHFKHLIMCREVSTKHSEWFWGKLYQILNSLIFRKISGKWNIPRKLWNILHFKHLIMCREVSTKHWEWF